MSPMNNRLLVPRKVPGLLDLVPGAAAAYSLRSLSNSYADPVVTVRRSSDDDEASFTASEVADGTLAAFCGAGDGLVTQWWDQSGNASHASQTTPGYQPKIVSSGVVVTEEGKPAIQFDGSDDFFVVAHAPDLNIQLSDSSVLAVLSYSSGFRIFQKGDGGGGDDYAYFFFLNNGLAVAGGYGTGLTASTSQQMWYLRWNTSTSAAFKDGAKIFFTTAAGGTVVDGEINPTLSPTANSDDLYIGKRNNPSGTEGNFGGSMQELLFWNTDVASQRELIEANAAWGWSV
jgi:hypothetical protein